MGLVFTVVQDEDVVQAKVLVSLQAQCNPTYTSITPSSASSAILDPIRRDLSIDTDPEVFNEIMNPERVQPVH